MSAQGGRRNRSPLHVRSSGAPFPVRGVLIVCVLYLLNKKLLILLCVSYDLHIVFFFITKPWYILHSKWVKSRNSILECYCISLYVLNILRVDILIT